MSAPSAMGSGPTTTPVSVLVRREGQHDFGRLAQEAPTASTPGALPLLALTEICCWLFVVSWPTIQFLIDQSTEITMASTRPVASLQETQTRMCSLSA